MEQNKIGSVSHIINKQTKNPNSGGLKFNCRKKNCKAFRIYYRSIYSRSHDINDCLNMTQMAIAIKENIDKSTYHKLSFNQNITK